jgi:hypothetical protein
MTNIDKSYLAVDVSVPLTIRWNPTVSPAPVIADANGLIKIFIGFKHASSIFREVSITSNGYTTGYHSSFLGVEGFAAGLNVNE